ncbi:MAG: kelch repeat-containing protein, partial [Terracidiphilus sp.]
MFSFATALVLAGSISASAQAPTLEGGWNQLSPSTPPPARFATSLAYDSAHAQLVMFGGFGDSGIVGDTWLWNGTNWTQANPASSPSARSNQTMVYDAAQGEAVMFGGATGAPASSRLGDTWLWNGTTNNWTQVTGLSSTPPARSSAAMAYDAATGQVVLFGGLGGSSSGGADLGDTWVWYQNSWYSESPASSPSARYGASMAYDAALGEVILFGGFDQSGNEDNDLWAWTGANWTQLSAPSSPAARDSAGMEYDPLLGQVVLFGGEQQTFNGSTLVSTYLSDTWVLTGNSPGNLTWTQQTYSTSPAARATNAMVYDAAQGQVVMFGGYGNSGQVDDTWTWGTPQGFGNINVCPSGQSTPAPCSNTLTLTYQFQTGAPVASEVVTQGTPNLDFTLSSATCSGNVLANGSCTVTVNFTPTAPGLRLGAVEILDTFSGAVLVTTPIYGIGAAPLGAFSPLITLVQSTGSQTLSSPTGVAVDAAGDLFIANTGGAVSENVLEVAAGGSVSTVGYQPNFPDSLAIDGAGDVFIGQYAPTVVEIPAGCTQAQIQTCQKTLGGFGEASAVAVDAAGDVFVGDQYNRNVSEIPVSNQGTQTVVYNPNDPSFLPQGLAVDLAGDLFIADYPEHKVLELPPGGSIASTVGFGWSSPQSVTLDAAGDLYVADSGLQEVVEIPAGCTVASCQIVVATATEPSLGGVGSNFTPYGVAVDSKGDVYIADAGLNRVDAILQQFAGVTFSESSVGNISGDSPESITLQNIGNQALNANSPGLVIVNPSFYQVAGSGTPTDCTASFSLAQGGDCNLSIDFDPLTSGLQTVNPFTITGSAVFDDNSLNNTSTQAVPLTGTSLEFGTEYLLTVTEGGAGSGSVTDNMSAISCSESNGSVTGTCSGNYASGAQVTLTANASGGSSFVGWGGACASAGTAATCVVTMSQAQNVSASFASQANFAAANVCPLGSSNPPCTVTMMVTINFPYNGAGYVEPLVVQVFTEGQLGPTVDFQLQPGGDHCSYSIVSTPGSCFVYVTFSPQAPGLRLGAVVVGTNIGETVTQLISGIGQAPETAFGPSMTGTYPAVTYSSQVSPVANLTGYSGITTDEFGNVYHLTGPSLVELAPPYTGAPTTVATGFSTAYSVAIDGAGNFYVADPSLNTYGEVVKLAPGCTSATASCATVIYAPSSHPGPIAVAVDASGNVFIAQNLTGVFEIPSNGGPQFTLYNPAGNSLGGMAVDAAGDLFVTDSGLHHVVEIPAGCTNTSCQTLIGSGWASPQDVAVDAAGDVIVGDVALTIGTQVDAGGVVEVPAGCTTAGCQILLWTSGQAPDPSEVAVTPTGQIFFVTDGTPVYEIDQSQPPAVSFGTTNDGLEIGPDPVTVQNIGNQALAGSVGALSAGINFAELSSTCTSFSLTPGAICSENFEFEPQSGVVGEVSDSAAVTDNSLNGSPASQSILLDGYGVPVTGTSNTLNVSFTGEGSGTVIDNLGTPITDCIETNNVASGACSESYSTTYATVTLTATASPGSNFVAWGAACASAGTNAQCVVTMTPTTNVAATFSPQALGSINVCAGGVAAGCIARTFAVSVNVPTSATVSTVSVVTQGASNLDFTAGAGSGCPGFVGPGTCIENVDFAPIAPGLRLGAVVLETSSGQITQLISGVGQGSAVAFSPATQTTVNTQSTSLNQPNGVAVDAAGDVFIANSDSAPPQVVEVAANGTVSTLGTSLAGPQGLAVDGAGNLFIADNELGQVIEVPANGGAQTIVYPIPANGSSSPTGVAVDGAGDLFVADYGLQQVVEVPANGGAPTTVYSGGNNSYPMDVAVDGTGDLFIADLGLGEVVEVPASGPQAVVYVPGSNTKPYAVAVDAAGDVYVANNNPAEVVEVPYGQYNSSSILLASGNGISGVAVDAAGDVFMPEQSPNQVVELQASQAPAVNFGSVPVNLHPVQTVTLQNIGNETLSSEASPGVTVNGGGLFLSYVSPPPSYCNGGSSFTVLQGQFCDVGIIFEPVTNGLVTGTAVITDNALNESPATQTINLEGTGTGGVSTNSLDVNLLGSGSGTVTDGASLNCSAANLAGCSTTYPTSTVSVTLTETPTAGSAFIGWSGACASAGTNPQCTVTLTSVTDVTANFTQESAGPVNVCSAGIVSGCAGSTLPVTFYFPTGAAVSRIQAVTQGATGLDFSVPNGGPCINSFSPGGSCTVDVTFTPTAPGLRLGAVQLLDSGGNLLATQLISGVGQGPEVAFTPGTQTTVAGSGINYPVGVAPDGAGNLYIANYGNGGSHPGFVLKVAPGGAQSTVLNAYTSAPGQVPSPIGVALDGAGNFYIADLYLPYAVKVTPSGVQTTVGSGLGRPIGIAVDGTGDVFIADQNGKQVVEVTPSGVQTTVPAVGLKSPNGVAVDVSGNVYISDNTLNEVVKVTPSGVQTTVLSTGLNDPYGLAVDAAGDVLIADGLNGRVVEVMPGGAQTTVGNGLNFPSGLAVDGAGDVFIGDQGVQGVFEVSQSQPELWIFESVNVGGRSNDVGYSIQNIGNQNLIGTVGTASNANFAVDLINSTCTSVNGISLTPGATCVTGIYAQPTVGGLVTGTVPVSDNSLNGNPATQAISVEATGLGSGTSYVLTVTDIGSGSGTVSSGDGQIGCVDTNGTVSGNPSCSASYSSGTVTLTATASAGSKFLGWGGACASSATSPSCAVTMNASVSVTASFGLVNLGSAYICAAGFTPPVGSTCSAAQTLTFNIPATTTIGAIQVVTQGISGLDFSQGSGSTCTGQIAGGNSCNVSVNFTPLAPGLRMGAVELYDNNGNLVATAPIYGIGQGPAAAFSPGAQATVYSGNSAFVSNSAAVDSAGDLFIAQTQWPTSNSGQVVEVAANGTQTTVGSGLEYPQGLAVDGAGDLYIADNNLSEVVKVPAGCTSSACQTTVGSGLSSQLGVAVDGAGDVFISSYGQHEVVEVPANGGPQTVVYNPVTGAGPTSSPVGLALDAAGDLFIADVGLTQVVEVPAGCTSSGCQVTIGRNWGAPQSVAVDAAGDVFVSDTTLEQVVEVPAGCTSSACQATCTPGNCAIVVANGIVSLGAAVDAAGDIFVANAHASRVVEVNESLPPSLNFALTSTGSTSTDSPQAVSVQNIGNQTLTGALTPVSTANFLENPGCATFTLAPGAICSTSFSFGPQTTGYLTDTAYFSDNNLHLASSVVAQAVNLSGVGDIAGQAATVTVPNLVGMTQPTATTTLTGAGLALGSVSSEYSSGEPAGSVIGENPAAGTEVSPGSQVKLLISIGEAPAPSPNPLTFENNYFVTGDYASGGVTLRGTGVNGMATGVIMIPDSTTSPGSQGVPDGADIIDAYLYWETLENTPTPSANTGTFLGYPVTGQQVGSDLTNYTDGAFTGTLRAYRADVNTYIPVGANGVRFASGNFSVSMPDGRTALPLTEGASLVVIYRVLVAPNSTTPPSMPLKSVVIYDGSAIPGTSTTSTTQNMQGFYDAVGGSAETTTLSYNSSNAGWNNTSGSATLTAHASQYNATLNQGTAYVAEILSTPVTNSDNDGILNAWKSGPSSTSDFFYGQPGYYDVKTQSWVPLPGAKSGEQDLFVQLDYMCGAVTNGVCSGENLYPSPDANGNDPLAIVQQAFLATNIHLHLQIGNAVPEDTCTDNLTTTPPQLCQFPSQPGVIGWKNSLEFSKIWPRNFTACASGGDCTARFPYGQKDSYHYVLFGHSLAIPAWNTRYGTLTGIQVVAGGTTTISTTGILSCPSRITISGVLGNPGINGEYNTTGCTATSMTVATPSGVSSWTYPNTTLPEPVIGVTSGTVTSISGYSDLGGADSAVTLALWETSPTQNMATRANVIAGTLYHEIGHTLGLSHGGLYYQTPGSYIPTFDVNCKPNYQSVMNYLFQIDGLGPSQAVAYSNQTLITLNDSSLNSATPVTDLGGNAATFPTSAWYLPFNANTTKASPAAMYCDGTALGTNSPGYYRVNGSIAPTINPAWASGENITYDGVPYTTLAGYNDTANIDLRQVGATGGEFAALANILSFGTLATPLAVAPGGNVSLSGGGTVTLGTNGSVNVGNNSNVTLGSAGTISSAGGVIVNNGSNVTLSTGGSVTLGKNGTIALPAGSGGLVTLGSGGLVTLGSGGLITLGSGGLVT